MHELALLVSCSYVLPWYDNAHTVALTKIITWLMTRIVPELETALWLFKVDTAFAPANDVQSCQRALREAQR